MEFILLAISLFEWLPLPLRVFAVGGIVVFLVLAVLKFIAFVLDFIPFW